MRKVPKLRDLSRLAGCQISCGGHLSKASQSPGIAYLCALVIAFTGSPGGVLAQTGRQATATRGILARLLSPQTGGSRENRQLNGGVTVQEEISPLNVKLSGDTSGSTSSRGDVVITKEAVPLKMGARVLRVVPVGVGLTVLDTRGEWLGVIDSRGGEEIRGWVRSHQVARPRIRIRVREDHLAKAKEGVDWSSAVVSSDGKKLAYVVRTDEGSRVVVDGKSGKLFDQIESGHPVLGRIGRRLAYAAKRAEDWFLIVDDEVTGPYDSIQLGHPVVSPGGENVLAFVRKGEKQVLVANGTEGVPHSRVLEGSPILSQDGKHFAYAAQNDKGWRVYVDGEEAASFDNVAIEDVTLEHDGSRFACIGKRDGLAVVNLDGEEVASHQNARLPLFLPGGAGLCYQAQDQGKWFMVVGSERSESFDEIGDYVVDVENMGVAFWACDGDRWCVVRGEKKSPEYDGFGRGSLTLAPAGQRWAYVAIQDGKAIVVIDEKESKPYEAVLAGTPVFSPTGESVAYAAQKEGLWRLCMDHEEQRAFDTIAEYSVRFTPDGSLPMSLIGRGDRLALAVGDAVTELDYLLPRGSLVLPVSENRLTMVAIRDEQFLRVEVEIESKR